MKLWSPGEVVRFLDTTLGHRLYAPFYLALSTGMRRGELLGLRWQDIRGNIISVTQNVVDIRGKPVLQTPKTAKGNRWVSISADVVEVLEKHRVRQQLEQAGWGILLTLYSLRKSAALSILAT